MTTTRLISIAAGVTPELETDPATFVSAAASAGWPGTGLWFDPETWSGSTTTSVKQRLDDSGVVPVDMEVIRIGPRGDSGERLIDVAAELGVRNVLTVSNFDNPEDTAERLAQLCQRAASAGIRVCIEFMRFTKVKTLADAKTVLKLTQEINAGILVDLLHVVRSGTSFDDIRAVDPSLFPYAQWCDGQHEPDGWSDRSLIHDAIDKRAIPGEGELATVEFDRLFDPQVPFSVEVRSKVLRDKFPDPIKRAAHLLERTQAALKSN